MIEPEDQETLWMNLDINETTVRHQVTCVTLILLKESKVAINIYPFTEADAPLKDCLSLLPSQWKLAQICERMTNNGSLSGLDALLGCPLIMFDQNDLKVITAF